MEWLNELEEVAVESYGDDYWGVWASVVPGDSWGEYQDTVGTQDLIQAQQQGVQVYDRSTGKLFDVS